MVYYIGIIGTRGDVPKEKIIYTKDQYEKIVTISEEYIQSLPYANSEICLVSGGCSFSDHIVITLFNKAKQEYIPFHSLIIFSPSKWDKVNKRYLISYSKTAKELNLLHDTFSKRLSRNTLAEIDEIQKDSTVMFDETSFTYLQRDKKIADKCQDVLIAFGWKESINKILFGGTKKTWDLAKNTKIKKYFKIPDKDIEYIIEDENLDNFILEYNEKKIENSNDIDDNTTQDSTNSIIDINPIISNTTTSTTTTTDVHLIHFIE